jgi:hypothetical protein
MFTPPGFGKERLCGVLTYLGQRFVCACLSVLEAGIFIERRKRWGEKIYLEHYPS